MKLSEMNEYAQTIAAVLAIAGIVFVGIQVQQSNRFAKANFIADFYDTQIEIEAAAIDSDVYSTVAKSIESPGDLSMEEVLQLDAFYSNTLLMIDKNFVVGETLGVFNDALQEYQLVKIREVAKSLFPGDFGRIWFEGSSFFSPDSLIRAALLEGLQDPSVEAIDVRLMRIVETSLR